MTGISYSGEAFNESVEDFLIDCRSFVTLELEREFDFL